MMQLPLDLVRAPAPTLVNFVAGRNAELLHSLQVAAGHSAAGCIIFIWGTPGSGRSHLLQGLVAAVRELGRTAAYLPCANRPQVDGSLQRLDCVAVDDVERLAPDAQVGLFNLYNALRDKGAVMAVSGEAPPQQLELRHDLATRLGWGLVYQVHPLTDEEKAQALQVYAAARGIRLSDEVSGYLLARVRRDMGTLLAVLDAVDRSSLAAKRAITMPFVREWLQGANNRDSGLGIGD